MLNDKTVENLKSVVDTGLTAIKQSITYGAKAGECNKSIGYAIDAVFPANWPGVNMKSAQANPEKVAAECGVQTEAVKLLVETYRHIKDSLSAHLESKGLKWNSSYWQNIGIHSIFCESDRALNPDSPGFKKKETRKAEAAAKGEKDEGTPLQQVRASSNALIGMIADLIDMAGAQGVELDNLKAALNYQQDVSRLLAITK